MPEKLGVAKDAFTEVSFPALYQHFRTLHFSDGALIFFPC